MRIIIKKLPANTLLVEIKTFVAPALKRFFPFKSGQIQNIKLLVLKDLQTHEYEFYGLIDIIPDKAGLRAIIKLKNQRIKNKPVLVRQYFERDWHNDRRLHAAGASPKILERRMGERRRGARLEIVENISGQFKPAGQGRKLI